MDVVTYEYKEMILRTLKKHHWDAKLFLSNLEQILRANMLK